MDWRDHARVTGDALKNWFVAQTQDSACVAAIWLVGLLIAGVPWAWLWALLAFFFHYVPHFGAVIAVILPAIVGAISGGWERLLYVLIVFAVIAVVDGFVLQPYFMRRTAKVPIWASILAPLVLVFFFTWWIALLAAPLLAIVFTYRALFRQRKEPTQLPSSGAPPG